MIAKVLRVLSILLVATGGFAVQASSGEEALATEPNVVVVGWTIDDSVAGNADGTLHPGETATLTVYLMNRASVMARGVSAQLFESLDHPGVEVEDKTAMWADLPPRGAPVASNAPAFRIRAATTLPCMWEIALRLEIVADGYAATRELTLVMAAPGPIDLARRGGRPFFYGADSFDAEFGLAIASGDIDGDGYDDLVLGFPGGNGPSNSQLNSGEAAIVYGGPGRMADTDLATFPSGTTTIYGVDTVDHFGADLAMGDLNGDGFDDVIIAAPYGNGPSNLRSSSGEVAVLYGSPARPAVVDLRFPPPEVAVIFGADVSDGLGGSVATGDLDGDGFDDLLIGSIYSDGPANNRLSAGGVVVVYGSSPRLAPVVDLAVPPAGIAWIHGAENDDLLGIAVGAGDLDGDGYDDMIASAPYASGPSNARPIGGEAAVIYGGPSRLTSLDLASRPAGAGVVFGADPGDFLGGVIATGDLNGDGNDEMVLSAGNADGPGNGRDGAGEAVVIHGSSSRLGTLDLASPNAQVSVIFGARTADGLGGGLHAADIDGDGFSELLVGVSGADGPGGARFQAGLVVAIPGSASLAPFVDLASPPAGVPLLHGSDYSDYMDQVNAGDFDGDGLNDLVVGASLADGPGNSRSSAGEVAVIPGQARSSYRYDADAFSFINATLGTNLTLLCDDCSTSVPLGFEFDFYGRKHTSVNVSSNGYLTFMPGAGDRLPIGCLRDGRQPAEMIAVFWDDLNPAAGGGVYSLLEGTAPNRRLTIEWAGVPLYPATGNATFEATLFESSNQILFQYQDVVFGSASDNGATAVVGVENATGLNGTQSSCFSPVVIDGSARRFRRFSSPTEVYYHDAESGTGGWTATGMWHRVTEPTCSPASRSGTVSWYYGQDSTCNYDTGASNFGELTSPALPGIPQDAALSFWSRRKTEQISSFDVSLVAVSAGGGPFLPADQVLDSSGQWRSSDDLLATEVGTFSAVDLSGLAGQDVRFQFGLYTGDAIENFHLGWMVDDITVNACTVHGAGGGTGAAAEGRATAQDDTICEDMSARLDALGSYCTACPSGLTYQWEENSSPIPGATGVTYDIPPGHAPGTFDYSVSISCPSSPACAAESDAASVRVVQRSAVVGPTLDVRRSGSDIRFTWTGVAGADDYVVYSSLVPSGLFPTEVGSASSGTTGLTVPPPPGTVVFFLVAGRNPTCGPGLQR